MLRVRRFATISSYPDFPGSVKLPPRPSMFRLCLRVGIIIGELSIVKFRHLIGIQENIRAKKMREAFIRLGPAFVKAGQALATRPDVGFSPEVCAELSKLQDQMPPFSSAEAHKLIAIELGAPVYDLFDELSEFPVAAASLGQVYRGRLKAVNGESQGVEVAVKVQRPGLTSVVELDVHVLRSVAAITQRIFSINSDIVGVTDQLVGRILEEIDYRNEAKFAQRFGDLYRSDAVCVPHIMPSLCSRKVLTMEWVDGVPLSDLARLTQDERLKNNDTSHLDPTPIIERGVICSLEQLLERGFFHGDPHPGNLMVTREGRLVYLDFGMMGEMDPRSRLDMLQLLVNFVNKDAVGLATDFLNLGFIPQHTPLENVQEELIKVFNNAQTTQQLDFQGVLLELSDVMFDFRFKIPPRFALVIRALGALEGTVIKVDPSFKVVARAYPHVLSQLLRDRSPEMRHILGRLIIDPNGQIRWERLERMIRAASSTSYTSEEEQFSPSFSVDVAAALSDALLSLYLPENAVMRRTLVRDGSAALDRLIEELLSGQRRSEQESESDGPSVDREDSKQSNSSDTQDPNDKQADAGVSPNAISSVLTRFSSLVNAAPGPWVRVAAETVTSKEGTQFCAQLAQTVTRQSAWRGIQWGIYAAGKALNREHNNWKEDSKTSSNKDDVNTKV